MICKLCDKPFTPNNTNHQTYCCKEHALTAKKVLDAWSSRRLDKITTPRGVIMKVLKQYNIPTYGVSFSDRSQGPGRFGANVFDA